MYNSTFTRNKNFTFSLNVVINDLCYISFVCLMTSPLPLSKSKLLCSPLKGVANFCLFSTESCHLQQTNKLFGIYSILNGKKVLISITHELSSPSPQPHSPQSPQTQSQPSPIQSNPVPTPINPIHHLQQEHHQY